MVHVDGGGTNGRQGRMTGDGGRILCTVHVHL